MATGERLKVFGEYIAEIRKRAFGTFTTLGAHMIDACEFSGEVGCAGLHYYCTGGAGLESRIFLFSSA